MAALLLAGLASALPASAQLAPRLTAAPGQGPVGTTVHLAGSGLPPLVAVYLTFGQIVNGDQDCRDARTSTPLPTTFADTAGAFGEDFTVPTALSSPEGPRATTPGAYCILATSAPGLNVQAFYTVIAAPPGDTATCRFILGFAALRARVPGQVGQCLQDEQHNPANGDGVQRTTGGLLVWRKADNWTAFTDGYRSWVAGPYGLERRLNAERFPWEGPGSGAGSALASPVAASTLTAYYAAIDRRAYAVAYALWQSPPLPYGQFVAGYQNTLQAAIRLGQPSPADAAGNLGVAFPAVILARQVDGSTSAFAGCYTLQTPKALPTQPYRIVSANIAAQPNIHRFSDAAAQAALGRSCG